jgi:hypothetical protein
VAYSEWAAGRGTSRIYRLASQWCKTIHVTGHIGFLASHMAGRGGPAPAGIHSVRFTRRMDYQRKRKDG